MGFLVREERLVEHVRNDDQDEAARDPEHKSQNAVDHANPAIENGV